jgi:predicted Zn-dependent peptidase
LAALGDNKAEYARLRCLEVLCPEEPYGVRGEGYAEDLAGITAKGLYGLYTEALAGAPAEWVLIGKPQAAAARLGDFFGRRAGAPPPPAQATRPRRPLQWVREAAEAAQGKICVALRAWRPVEFLPLLLFCEMLGGGSGSLLFTRARQRENLCYYIHASVCRQKSIVLVQSGVDPKNYEKILTATLQALESLQKNIPPAQLERAKGELSKQFLLLRDNPGGLIDFIVSQRLAGADAGPEEAAAQVRALGPEAVRQAAENLYVDTVYTLGG